MSFDVKYAVCGNTSAPTGWAHPSSSTETHELIYCRRGRIYIAEGFDRFVVSSGEVIILPAGTRRYGYRGCDAPTELYWVHFSGELGTLPHISCPDGERLNRLFADLIYYSRTPEYEDEACRCVLCLILYELQRASAVGEDDPNARLYAMCEWIAENSNRRLRVCDVASHFSYNEDYITRLFKRHYKGGIKAYIDSARIKRIRGLLLSTNMRICDIAEACGFPDSKGFQKFFKYHEGVSATEFRELYFGNAKPPAGGDDAKGSE
ncbi:MAG: AraC family transcriptional regulator [Firmicutes bacterium]|nr:AraC family transcriptional regulator [Bacillota bacterium]